MEPMTLDIETARSDSTELDAPEFDTSEFDAAAIVTRATQLVREHYVFPEVGDQIAALLLEQLANGQYATATTVAELAELVTVDLQSLNSDRHLRLKHHLDPQADLAEDDARQAVYAALARDDMSGIRRVERLAGNVGLVCLADMLHSAEIVGGAVAAAMTLIAETRALIIDLRQNRGGDPATVALVISYLVDERTHLNSMVSREPSKAAQQWTLPWVPGPKFGADKPVWVLTSAATFSGAEELAYDLQQLGRATMVGETTKGGANAREGFTLHPHLELAVPVVAARNPVSNSNWEGVGVTPDVAVDADSALDTAYRLALEVLVADVTLGPGLRREIATAQG